MTSNVSPHTCPLGYPTSRTSTPSLLCRKVCSSITWRVRREIPTSYPPSSRSILMRAWTLSSELCNRSFSDTTSCAPRFSGRDSRHPCKLSGVRRSYASSRSKSLPMWMPTLSLPAASTRGTTVLTCVARRSLAHLSRKIPDTAAGCCDCCLTIWQLITPHLRSLSGRSAFSWSSVRSSCPCPCRSATSWSERAVGGGGGGGGEGRRGEKEGE